MPPLATTSRGKKRSMDPHPSEPAKKQSKWSAEEDMLVIGLRGSGMKWEDISENIPGRSSISCRLHYQNYLERRCEWDDERINKLARLYERFKSEMWAKIAEEMVLPWRAVEAMHWQVGEVEMARRAGVVPFTLANVGTSNTSGSRRSHLTRGHTNSRSGSQSQGVMRYEAGHMVPPPGQMAPARRDDILVRPPPMPPDATGQPQMADLGPPQGLAPLHLPAAQGHGGGFLPGIAELTTGMSPYSTPAYSAGMHSVSPVHSSGESPYGPGLPYNPAVDPSSSFKRSASPGFGYASRQRHMDPRQDVARRELMP